MQATAGPFPRADKAPTQPQGRPGTHCVAPAHKRSMLEVGMGGVWGREAFLRPFLHWQCQLGTVTVHRTENCRNNKIMIFQKS